MEDALAEALLETRRRHMKFTVALCPWLPASGKPRVEALALAESALTAVSGCRVLTIDLTGFDASKARHAFIRAVCSGSSVLALGLEGLSADALEAAEAGLSSIQQWNPRARALALSACPLPRGSAREAWTASLPEPAAPRR